jgi:hypothetical protein
MPSELLEPSICRASYHCIRIATNNSNLGGVDNGTVSSIEILGEDCDPDATTYLARV